jgi:hypothetical protein
LNTSSSGSVVVPASEVLGDGGTVVVPASEVLVVGVTVVVTVDATVLVVCGTVVEGAAGGTDEDVWTDDRCCPAAEAGVAGTSAESVVDVHADTASAPRNTQNTTRPPLGGCLHAPGYDTM